MSENFAGDFEHLLRQEADREELMAQSRELQSRYTTYLEDRGEVFALSPEEEVVYNTVPEVIEQERAGLGRSEADKIEILGVIRKAGLIKINQLKVLELATIKLQLGEYERVKGEPPAVDFRKHLQIELMLEDRSDAWHDLVVEEFQGEGLTLDDVATIDQYALEKFASEKENSERLAAAQIELEEVLWSTGKVELTEDEILIIGHLAMWKCIASPDLMRRSIENTREYIESVTEFDEHWAAVLNHLTQPPPDNTVN